HAPPAEDRSDIAARVICLLRIFGSPGSNEVSPRVAAIDWQFQALARLSESPEFKRWSLPGPEWRLVDTGNRFGSSFWPIAARGPCGAQFRSCHLCPAANDHREGRRPG